MYPIRPFCRLLSTCLFVVALLGLPSRPALAQRWLGQLIFGKQYQAARPIPQAVCAHRAGVYHAETPSSRMVGSGSQMAPPQTAALSRMGTSRSLQTARPQAVAPSSRQGVQPADVKARGPAPRDAAGASASGQLRPTASQGGAAPAVDRRAAGSVTSQVVRASYSQPVAGPHAHPGAMPPQATGYAANGPYMPPMAVAGAAPAVARQAGGVPRELSKVVLPRYKIEPPDILVVEAVHIVPRAPYRLRPFDVIDLQVTGTLPEEPIAGAYTVQPEGVIRLGFAYGSVAIADMTVDQAKQAIEEHLRRFLKEPVASVGLSQISAVQQIAGEHLVGPDGTVTLGSYGSVRVVGLTLGDAKAAIENYLSQFLEDPEVSVDVYAYNSKVYYVIFEGAGLGDRVYRFPVTGNETVLDAISQIQGLDSISSTRMWIARPSPIPAQFQILPVDWKSITAQAATGSNYQLLPGDRLFIAQDPNVALDTWVGKVISPWERMMGFITLGVGTVTRLSGPVLRGGGNPRGFGGF